MGGKYLILGFLRTKIEYNCTCSRQQNLQIRSIENAISITCNQKQSVGELMHIAFELPAARLHKISISPFPVSVSLLNIIPITLSLLRQSGFMQSEEESALS